MPISNRGLQIARDLIAGLNTNAVDSVGFGASDVAEAATVDKLGSGSGNNGAGQLKTNSYWKTGANKTVTSSQGADDSTQADPWAQWEAEWSETEISAGGTVVLFEMGTSRATLTGTNPAGNNGTNLYSRKRIGGTVGIGKTDDARIAARIKVTY